MPGLEMTTEPALEIQGFIYSNVRYGPPFERFRASFRPLYEIN